MSSMSVKTTPPQVEYVRQLEVIICQYLFNLNLKFYVYRLVSHFLLEFFTLDLFQSSYLSSSEHFAEYQYLDSFE